jgi:hypothetical protein
MELADAQLLRTVAAVDQQALDVVKQLRTIQAPRARIEEAEANSVNAARVLRMAIARWLRTL